jgi:hypothetical protein
MDHLIGRGACVWMHFISSEAELGKLFEMLKVVSSTFNSA